MQHQSIGFQAVNPAPLPPHIPLACEILFRKSRPYHFSCPQLEKFDEQEFEKIDLYSRQTMSKKNELSLITKEYGTLENPAFDYMDASLGLTVTRQQLPAKTYHSPSYKIAPELYDISQAQMKAIYK